MREVERFSGSNVPDGEGGRLLRLMTSCPRCGSRPALRITETVAGVLLREARGARLGTYQCQRRGCGAIYDLRATDCVVEG